MHELIERSIKEASQYFQNFFIHDYGRQGFLHMIDARIKLLGTFLLIVLAVSTFDPMKVGVIFVSSLILAAFSRIGIKKVLKRIWLFTLFSFIIVLPLTLSFRVEDLLYVLLFTLRVATSLIAIQVLILSTPFNDIVYAMRGLKFPKGFVSTLWLAYRYIILMFTELMRVMLARESRRMTKGSHMDLWRKGGESLGLFFIRTFERAERVQLAMRARGEKVVAIKGSFTRLDKIYILFMAAVTLWWMAI
jgi:cobalt/nickel transport system permease protein